MPARYGRPGAFVPSRSDTWKLHHAPAAWSTCARQGSAVTGHRTSQQRNSDAASADDCEGCSSATDNTGLPLGERSRDCTAVFHFLSACASVGDVREWARFGRMQTGWFGVGKSIRPHGNRSPFRTVSAVRICGAFCGALFEDRYRERGVRSGTRNSANVRPSTPPINVSQARDARTKIESSPLTASVTMSVKA
jgi:hypothetical protein